MRLRLAKNRSRQYPITDNILINDNENEWKMDLIISLAIKRREHGIYHKIISDLQVLTASRLVDPIEDTSGRNPLSLDDIVREVPRGCVPQVFHFNPIV